MVALKSWLVVADTKKGMRQLSRAEAVCSDAEGDSPTAPWLVLSYN